MMNELDPLPYFLTAIAFVVGLGLINAALYGVYLFVNWWPENRWRWVKKNRKVCARVAQR